MRGALALLLLVSAPSSASAQWSGFVDVSAERDVRRYDFEGAAGSNENYYDGDFGDYDGDGRIDRALISRYGLLFNAGDGAFVPVSTQRGATSGPNSAPSLTGYLFGDEVRIGNDAVQWVDLDGDGDLDVVQGGNGEPFVVQQNRGGWFAVTQRLSGSAVQIVTTDLERDGDADLIVACWFPSGPDDFTVFVNDGRGNLTDETAARGLALAGNEIIGIASGDVDRDGDFDLLVVSRAARALWVFLNDGAGRFVRTDVPVPGVGRFRRTSGFAQGLNLGDIDDDGDLDLVMATDDYVGSSETVGHLIFINDGSGGFTEESGARFVVGAGIIGRLVGANGKLMDVDYDGDLDFFAFTDLAGPPLNFQLFLNDGGGRFTYTRDGVPAFGGARPTSVGADVDIADLDQDGTYDIWVGIGGGQVTHLQNTYLDPGGRADRVRDLRVVSADAAGVRIAWDPPPFAATARHYVVYRSLSAGREPRDRAVLRTVAISPFEDEGFAAPITRFTRTDELRDADVSIEAGRIQLLDPTAEPGVRYAYSVAHVGPENARGEPSEEVVASAPAAAGPDTAPPAIDIISPTVESWGASPRIVVAYADGGSGVDEGTLSITLSEAAGAITAGTNLADRALVVGAGAAIVALGPSESLPIGAVELVVRVSDRAGNEAVARRTFAVTVAPRGSPSVDASATPSAGEAPLRVAFEGSGAAPGGAILRWEWYFGDGATAVGRRVAHVYASEGTFDVTLRALDDTGAVAIARTSVAVSPCPGVCAPPDAGRPGVDGGGVVAMDDAGRAPGGDAGPSDDRVPARGGCSTLAVEPGGGATVGWLVALGVMWRRRRRRARPSRAT